MADRGEASQLMISRDDEERVSAVAGLGVTYAGFGALVYALWPRSFMRWDAAVPLMFHLSFALLVVMNLTLALLSDQCVLVTPKEVESFVRFGRFRLRRRCFARDAVVDVRVRERKINSRGGHRVAHDVMLVVGDESVPVFQKCRLARAESLASEVSEAVLARALQPIRFFLVDDSGAVDAFRSVSAAIETMEGIDVLKNRLRLFDGSARELTLATDLVEPKRLRFLIPSGRVFVTAVNTSPDRERFLREHLQTALTHHGYTTPSDDLSACVRLASSVLLCR